MTRKAVIAIDGPPGSGKSTLARELARRLKYRLIDTGAMYRASALIALRKNVPLDDAPLLKELLLPLQIDFKVKGEGQRITVNGEDVEREIRTEEMGMNASIIALVEEVRQILVLKQQLMGKEGGVVCEGRDATTVIFPLADFKFFIDALAWKRAERRYGEMVASGKSDDFVHIYDEIIRRDIQDSTRHHSPLRMADDAIYIDTTPLTKEEVLEMVMKIIEDRGFIHGE